MNSFLPGVNELEQRDCPSSSPWGGDPALQPLNRPNSLPVGVIPLNLPAGVAPPVNPDAETPVALNAQLGVISQVFGQDPNTTLNNERAAYSAWFAAFGAQYNSLVAAAGPADANWTAQAPPTNPTNNYSAAPPPLANTWTNYSQQLPQQQSQQALAPPVQPAQLVIPPAPVNPANLTQEQQYGLGDAAQIMGVSYQSLLDTMQANYNAYLQQQSQSQPSNQTANDAYSLSDPLALPSMLTV
jgi:hypothetical protein